MQYSIEKSYYDNDEEFDYLVSEISKSFEDITFVDCHGKTTIEDESLLEDIAAELEDISLFMNQAVDIL